MESEGVSCTDIRLKISVRLNLGEIARDTNLYINLHKYVIIENRFFVSHSTITVHLSLGAFTMG